ncbi:biopolymer transporter ExbD [Denitratisoma sp. DHT3]|uniref:ExbD/TolR family protein n=1 Tax=Denitratisoma sp. DHT3 TaxID=1981880 RepID=UPI0011982AF9|nr:biopolymer transporter ExbD [Denitratisoma sp. DHT3]QDX81809.1 biopolymer transporter ExbD [Denitratisoma sp. DHT3]
MAFHPTPHAQQPLAEINMIPLIDVMLVLLIVFIVAAPLLTHAVKIDLPRATSAPVDLRPEVIQLGIRADGSLYWNGAATTEEALPERMREAARHVPQPEIHLYADARTPYETLARVMAMSARAGLGRIGFVSNPGKTP